MGLARAPGARPGEKVGTALALRGEQGVGKTKVGEVMGSIIGDGYLAVADPRFVSGRFNGHLAQCLLLHADEGFWAGDRIAESKLKDLITGSHHMVELKGKEPFRVRNLCRLLVTGNPDWLVPAGMDERRFAVLDVGAGCKGDHGFFAALDAQMDAGGREALLHELLAADLTGIDLRRVPKHGRPATTEGAVARPGGVVVARSVARWRGSGGTRRVAAHRALRPHAPRVRPPRRTHRHPRAGE